jgi:hypothetical protein
MSKSTFSGPIRSENGFQHVAKNSTTGQMDNFTTLAGDDIRRYILAEYWKKRPALNAVIATAYSDADATAAANTAITTARVIANKDFEVLGTNMTTALATFDTTRAGLTITTAGADEDQAIIAPHLDATQTGWASVLWGTENQVEWECSISTNAIDNQKVWAGLKLTNDQLIATDADQIYFKFQTDATNSEAFDDYTLLHLVHSIGGTDYISALPITVAANTTYHLKIEIDSNRTATIFVDGVQYNVTTTSGSTGGTAVTALGLKANPVRTAALTNDVSFIPYIGIEAGAAAAEGLDVHYQGISRLIFE